MARSTATAVNRNDSQNDFTLNRIRKNKINADTREISINVIIIFLYSCPVKIQSFKDA